MEKFGEIFEKIVSLVALITGGLLTILGIFVGCLCNIAPLLASLGLLSILLGVLTIKNEYLILMGLILMTVGAYLWIRTKDAKTSKRQRKKQKEEY